MLYKHIVALSALALCLAEEGKREARNPGLLHLAHAGQSVGNYVVAGPRVGGAGHGGGGGGGPHIVIVGGQPAHVTTHVAGRDSLEELDEDLRQHLGRQQGEQYNSGFQDPVRQQLAYSALKDLKEGRFGNLSPSQDHSGSAGAASYGGGQAGVGYRIAPVLVNHQPLGHPQQGQAYSSQQISNIVSEPVPTHQGVLGGHSGPQYRLSDSGFQHGVTPSSTNYAAPPHYSPTPAPLSHTLATPVIHTVLPARVPLHHSLRPQGFQGVPYHTPLAQGPVFIPVRTIGGHQPQYQTHRFAVGHTPNAEYSPSHFTGRSHERSPAAYSEEYRANAAETPRYYGNVQERRPVVPYQSQIHQRDFDSGESTGYRQGSAEAYKYGSGEVLAKSAGTNSLSFRSKFPSDDKGSQEDVSDEAVSEEQKPGTVNYSFADDHRTEGRSYGGDGKVATSYQSVTLETHDPSPSYYNQKHH